MGSLQNLISKMGGKLLALALLFCLVFKTANALKCYSCSSVTHESCGEGGGDEIECPNIPGQESLAGATNACHKLVLGSLTQKGCLPLPPGREAGCSKSSKRGHGEMCYCT